MYLLRRKILAILLAAAILIGGCVSQDAYDRVQQENNTLKQELDDLRFGAARLLAQAQEYYADKQFDDAASRLNVLLEKHNDAPEARTARMLQRQIEQVKRNLEEEQIWANTRDGDTGRIGLYLAQFPNGRFAAEARTRYNAAVRAIEADAYESATRQNSSYAWQAFLEAYPDRPDAEAIRKRIIQAEIGEIARNENVSPIPVSYQTDDGYSSSSSVSITNNTVYELTVRYSGPTVTAVSIAPGGTRSVALQSGTYRVAATAGSASCAGTEVLHGRYSSSYAIRTSSSYSNYYR